MTSGVRLFRCPWCCRGSKVLNVVLKIDSSHVSLLQSLTPERKCYFWVLEHDHGGKCVYFKSFNTCLINESAKEKWQCARIKAALKHICGSVRRWLCSPLEHSHRLFSILFMYRSFHDNAVTPILPRHISNRQHPRLHPVLQYPPEINERITGRVCVTGGFVWKSLQRRTKRDNRADQLASTAAKWLDANW